MSYQDHLESCSYCSSSKKDSSKPTISIKSTTSYNKRKRLGELSAIIRGTSYAGLSPWLQTKGASSSADNTSRRPGPIEREVKLKELGKMVRG